MRKLIFLLIVLAGFILACTESPEIEKKFKADHGDSDLQMERIDTFYHDSTL